MKLKAPLSRQWRCMFTLVVVVPSQALLLTEATIFMPISNSRCWADIEFYDS